MKTQNEYENRFRSPEFVAVWSRWNTARYAWRKASEHVDFKYLGNYYDPEPDKIPEGSGREAAREYVESRRAYKAKLAEYGVGS
jgi:hypothetical protein